MCYDSLVLNNVRRLRRTLKLILEILRKTMFQLSLVQHTKCQEFVEDINYLSEHLASVQLQGVYKNLQPKFPDFSRFPRPHVINFQVSSMKKYNQK